MSATALKIFGAHLECLAGLHGITLFVHHVVATCANMIRPFLDIGMK